MNNQEFTLTKQVALSYVQSGIPYNVALVLAREAVKAFLRRSVVRVASLLCVLILSHVGLSQAGEFYATGSVGLSVVTGLPENGTWYQDGMASEKDRTSLGYKAGLGYRFTNVYLEANYISLGAIRNEGQFVGDHDYDTAALKCIKCDDVSNGWIQGNTQTGIELIAGYQWNREGLIQPRLHVGGYATKHSTTFEGTYPSVGRPQGATYSGHVFGVTGGLGACVSWLCADISYYQAISHTQFPFARGVVMPTLSINIPLTSW